MPADPTSKTPPAQGDDLPTPEQWQWFKRQVARQCDFELDEEGVSCVSWSLIESTVYHWQDFTKRYRRILAEVRRDD